MQRLLFHPPSNPFSLPPLLSILFSIPPSLHSSPSYSLFLFLLLSLTHTHSLSPSLPPSFSLYQVAALVCMYGPKVTMALAISGLATNTGQAVCVELTMGTDRSSLLLFYALLCYAINTALFIPCNFDHLILLYSIYWSLV
jgi:hypothetical protein